MAPVDHHISHARAAASMWGAYAFYAVACAWPDAGWCPPIPAFPMMPGWVFVALCVGAGILASRRGWPMFSGYAAGCLGAICLRAAEADDGAFAAGTGFAIALAIVACTMLKVIGDLYEDEDGVVPAREAATLLWISGCIAACGGLVLADLFAWVVSHAT